MITAVLFDLFETLITESGIQPTRASSLATTLGLERDAYREEWKMRRSRVVRGQMSFAEALTEISQTLMGRAHQDTIKGICQQRASWRWIGRNQQKVTWPELTDQKDVLKVVTGRLDEQLAWIVK